MSSGDDDDGAGHDLPPGCQITDPSVEKMPPEGLGLHFKYGILCRMVRAACGMGEDMLNSGPSKPMCSGPRGAICFTFVRMRWMQRERGEHL